MVLLELVEGRVERTEGVTEEAMIGFSRRRGRICGDRVGALVVRDRYRAAREIVSAIGMRECNGTRTQAGQQQERDTCTADPRRAAEHEIELSDRGGLRQALADYALSFSAFGCTRAMSVSEPCIASPSM